MTIKKYTLYAYDRRNGSLVLEKHFFFKKSALKLADELVIDYEIQVFNEKTCLEIY